MRRDSAKSPIELKDTSLAGRADQTKASHKQSSVVPKAQLEKAQLPAKAHTSQVSITPFDIYGKRERKRKASTLVIDR